MAFKKKNIYEFIGAALVLSALLSTASAVDCLGKSFHCVNSTHFMICVDVGGGVSQSIADFTIPCPPPTVCQGNNHFECEFPVMTTPSTTLSNVISESTIPWEEVDVTTVSPPQNTEFSEKYMNTESLTSLSANSYTTDATVDFTTEVASLIDSVNITETRTVVTETLPYDTTTSKDDIGQTITENNMTSAGEILSEIAHNYTSVHEVTDDAGLVSTSTEKTVPSKLNSTEATSLIYDISTTETGPTVTEALPYDTTTNQDVITQTITEHNAGKLLTEIANEGLVSNSTIKAIPSKFNATEATSLIYNISSTETGPTVTEALPYDTTTNQDVITQTITEHNAGKLLSEIANKGLVSNSTIKEIPSKFNATEATSLIYDTSITDTEPAVTKALPDDTTTIRNVKKQTKTVHNVASASELLTETANNYSLVQQVTDDVGLVSISTVASKLNNTEAASLIDDISRTETGPAATEALPYDTTTNQAVITQTITEHNKASAGELLKETAINYTQIQEVTTDEGSVSTTMKAIPPKLNTAEADSLTDDISITETNLAVTEALPYDTTASQDIVTQTITEHNVASAGESLTETANNYTLVQEVTNNAGSVSTSTEKVVPLQLNTTEAASLIDDISITETSPAITEALPYDTTTSKDVITETITEHNVESAGESFTETANNYTLVQEVTNNAGLVSTSTEKVVPLQLNTTEAASLIDDISITETSPAITEALPLDTTTSKDVITERITEHNVESAGESFTETANNYTLVQEVTNNTGLVSTSTEKVVPLQLNTTEAASLIDDISITETSPAITEALPYDTTTSKDVITERITEHNVESAGESFTETANNYTLVQEVTNNAGLVSTSTEKVVALQLNTTEADSLINDISITETSPAITEALPYDTATSKNVITEAITKHNVESAGESLTESANTLLQKITTDEGLVSPSTEKTNVDIRETVNVTRESAFYQVKTTSESISTEISVVDELPTTTDNVFATDANVIKTDPKASNTNMLDNRPTNESAAATTVDGIITADVNIFTTEQPAVVGLLQTTLITNSLNYATTTSESTTVEKNVFNKRNLTVFGKDTVTHSIANSDTKISQNLTSNQPLSTKIISSESFPTEQTIVNMSNNSISTDVTSILTTETVYLITNDTWSKPNEDDSIFTEASVGTELPTKGYVIIPDVSTVHSEDLVHNVENQSMFNYVTPNSTTMVEEKIRTEGPNITLFEKNTVTEATTNLITDSPLFLKQNLTDNAPVNQIPNDNTGLGSYSNNPDNFARGTEIVTTDETKYNVLDQATLGPDSIVAVTELPTSIDDNFTIETNGMKNNVVPSAENTLLNTNISNHTITTKTVIVENNIGAEKQNFTLNNDHSTEAPPHIAATNTNDNIINTTTRNIDIEENLATAVNDTAKKNLTASVKNLGNSLKDLEFVEYNATEFRKPIIIDENLLSNNDYIITPTSDIENKINSSFSDNIYTEKSSVQYNVSTEQLTIKEIHGSITTDTALETGQAISEVNNQKQIPVNDAGSVVSFDQQIFDKTRDLDVETGTLLEVHTIPSFINKINKVEVNDNYHLDLVTDGITEEPNYFIHGDTTSAPFIVTTAMAADVESYNKVGDEIPNLEPIRPTDVIYNALNPISNIIFNTNVNQSDVNKVEATTVITTVISVLSQEKNLNPIENQAKEYIQKMVGSFVMKGKPTESNLKESKTSFHATVATDKPDGIKPEFENHKDLFIAEETKKFNTNLVPTTSISDKNEATLNYDQFNYLTDSSLNDNIENKTNFDSQIAAETEDTSTLNAINAHENKNDLQGIIINTTDNKTLISQEGSTNYLTTTFKTDVLESEKANNYNSLKSGLNVQDPQNHNPPTKTYIELDVVNYPKLTIMEDSFSQVYKTTQIPSQNNYFTTTASIVTNDATKIIADKSTSINSVDLNEASVVNDNIYLPQLDKTLQRPAISSVITDKQKSYFNTGNQDDDGLTTEGSNQFATADVNVVSTKIGNHAIDLPEKTIGHREAAATMSSQVTQFETTTVFITDANQNKTDKVPSVLQTRSSTPKIPQFNDVKNVHQLIGDVFNTASETSSQRTFTDANYYLAQSKSSVQKPAETPYPATSTSRTINAPNPANEAKVIKSTDNPLTQPQVVTEIRADVNQITSSSVIANAEQSHVSSITPTKFLPVSRNLSQPRVIDVNASSLNQDTNNSISITQGNLEPQYKTVTNQATVITKNLTHNNSITAQNNKIYVTSNFNKANESINVSRKIDTIAKTLIPQNHANASKEFAKTQQNATSSHKVVNTVNSTTTTQASVERVPLRPVSSVTEHPAKQVRSSPQFKYNCINGTRGRYSDKNDCRKFYICIGNNQPIVGTCPGNTVFSDIKKLCTRNMSHCIRENQFKCPYAGRFSDLINDVYYICVGHKNSLYRFKFQCQKGFSLNKTVTRCMENKVILPNDSVSISSSDGSESSTASSTSKSSSTSSISSGSRGDSDSSNSSQSKKSVEKNETGKEEEPEKPDNKEEDESEELFVCRKEGKFPIRNECRRYYLCKKNRKSEYRRKIKKCRSGDVFHKSKKRCVDAESYEC